MGKCKKCNKEIDKTFIGLFTRMIFNLSTDICVDCLLKEQTMRHIKPERVVPDKEICRACKEEADIEIKFLNIGKTILVCTHCFDNLNNPDKKHKHCTRSSKDLH